MISPIGKIGVRSPGPAGSPVCGFSGGSGSPGRSGSRLTQCVGMASSPRTYFVGSLIRTSLRPNGRGGEATARRRGAERVRRYSPSVISSCGRLQSMYSSGGVIVGSTLPVRPWARLGATLPTWGAEIRREGEGGPPRWSGAAALKLCNGQQTSGRERNCPGPERRERGPSWRSNLGVTLRRPCDLIRTRPVKGDEPPRWSDATALRCWPAGGRRGGERAPWGRCGEREWPVRGPGHVLSQNDLHISTPDARSPLRLACERWCGQPHRPSHYGTPVTVTDEAPAQGRSSRRPRPRGRRRGGGW